MENIIKRLKQATRKRRAIDTEDVFHLLEEICVYCCDSNIGGCAEKNPLPPKEE